MMNHTVQAAKIAVKLHRLKSPKGVSNKRCSELDEDTTRGNQRKRKRKLVVIPGNSEQLESLELAARYMTKRPCEVSEGYRRHVEQRWLDGLTFRDRHLLLALNPWAGELWSGWLHDAYELHGGADPHFAVTILDRDWDLMVDNYSRVDPTAVRQVLQTMRKQLQTAFRGASFLFMVDVSVEREAGVFNGTRRLCLHLHGIVWLNRRKLRAAKRHFAGGHYGAPSLKTKVMYNAEGWLGYMSRDPRLGNHWYQERASWERRYHRRNDQLFSGQRQHLLRLFRHVSKPICASPLALGKGSSSRR